MKVAVIGTGRMGSWFATVLSEYNDVAVYDRQREKTEKLRGVRILKDIVELENYRPDLLINAVNLGSTIEAFNEVIPHLSKNCIISDIASVKGELNNFYEKQGLKFVSTHPMFGPTNTDMKMLQGESAIIVSESDQEGKKFFRNIYSRVGLDVREITFEEHDRMMAYSLTLPFTASLVFAGCVDNNAVPGTNFKKHLEIARGLLYEDETLLSEILFNQWSVPQIEMINNMLQYLKHIVLNRDYEELSKFLRKLKININI